MKNIIKISVVILSLHLFTGCYDREILDHKDFFYTLPKVENVSHIAAKGKVTLSWDIPENISDSFKRPLEVIVQVVENDMYKQKHTLVSVDEKNERTSLPLTLTSSSEYRFIIKLVGYLQPEEQRDGFTDRVVSEGVVYKL